MGFFIADAFAQDAGAPAGGGFGALLFPILLLVVFYFLLIRPQQKRAKEHRKMVEALAKGDEVVSTGGIAGRITEVGETSPRAAATRPRVTPKSRTKTPRAEHPLFCIRTGFP